MAGAIHQLPIVAPMIEKEHKKETHRSSDLLWREYFRDSSRWWDNRHSKLGPAFPDFKHKVTKEPLWIDEYNPSWVCQELIRRGLAASKNELFHQNGRSSDDDESTSFVILLRACAKSKDLYRGSRIHDDVLRKGLLEKCSDALVTMYAKCGALAKAKELLDMYCSKDIYAWTALISAYARQGQSEEALNCFEKMQHVGLSADAVTFASILKVCGSLKAAEKGKGIHDEIARLGMLENDVVLGTALVDMYVKCGALDKAQCVLEELSSRDAVSWNCLIAGYTQQGQAEQALTCFKRMRHEGLSPDAMTFSCILKACGSIGAVKMGEEIHDEITRKGLLENNIVLSTAVVDMYAKCGVLMKAQEVLEEIPSRDVVSWSALISGYTEQGQGEQALNCFERMQREGLSPDRVTFISILKACATIGAVHKGKLIHDEIAKQGLLKNDVVLGTALVDMYARCGDLLKAEQVLEELPFRNVVPWSALIAGHVEHGHGAQALSCFERMQHRGFSPDAVTFSCILTACGSIKALDKGEKFHDEIDKQVLSGQVLKCFEQMQCEGLSPNAVTFSCVLSACNHLGLVEDGHFYFVNMSTKYGVTPILEHYTCMVDLFGRAGHLVKAISVIQEMPFSDYSSVLSVLLGACRKWGDVRVGRWAFDWAIQVEKSNGTAYILMADIYAAAGMQEDSKNVEALELEC